MIRRTIEISQHPAHLSVHLEQLRIRRHTDNESGPFEASIPCEDIGVVVVDQPATTYSHRALAKLVEHGAAVVICGNDHLPCGMLLPISGHTEVASRVAQQVAATRPRCKQLWKQIVQAKVRAQAEVLSHDASARRKLLALVRSVRSGDPSNVEAQAARIYWSKWLDPDTAFRRRPRGKDALNAMLNYGYAVMRAAVGRAIVAAGFIPALGIQHSNRANPFCLADDLLEPLRPVVDARVRELHYADQHKLDQPTKAALLELLTVTVVTGDQKGPLLVALHRYVGSLAKCFAGQGDKLLIPMCTEADDDK